MALRGIHEYIARDVCVSPNYLTIVGDCQLLFCHRTKAKACGT